MLSDEYKRYIEQIAAKIRREVSGIMREKFNNNTPYKNTVENFKKIIEICGGTFGKLPDEISDDVKAVYISLGKREYKVLHKEKGITAAHLAHELGHHYIAKKGQSPLGTTFFYKLRWDNKAINAIQREIEKEDLGIEKLEPHGLTDEEYYHHEMAAEYFAAAFMFPADILIAAVEKARNGKEFDAVEVANELNRVYGLDFHGYDVQSRWRTLQFIKATNKEDYE